jgi:hypothetical protein
VGKDYVASQLGYRAVPLASPIHALTNDLLGVADKNIPGVRELMQSIGQWGRGVVSQEYPLTLRRVEVTERIRERQMPVCRKHPLVCWETFGLSDSFWLDALQPWCPDQADIPYAITGLRFVNEFDTLIRGGIEIWGVACADATLADRRGAQANNSALDRDTSETLLKQLLDVPPPSALRVPWRIAGIVWNDASALPGTGRSGDFYRVA